jgi:hypothetical protein
MQTVGQCGTGCRLVFSKVVRPAAKAACYLITQQTGHGACDIYCFARGSATSGVRDTDGFFSGEFVGSGVCRSSSGHAALSLDLNWQSGGPSRNADINVHRGGTT